MIFRVHSFFDFVIMLAWNAAVMGLWHLLVLVACTHLSKETISFNRPRFAAKQWEKNGRFYRDKLKINAWKDYMPQYVSKDGFSKETLEKNPTLEYVEEFLVETCRGEWYHTSAMTGIVFFFLMDPLPYNLILTGIMLVGHGACVVIQRYNRFRLLLLRKKLERDARRRRAKTEAFEVSVGDAIEEKLA